MISLLDFLAEKTDCIGLSELRDTTKYEQVHILLASDECRQFTLEQWNYALSYILNTPLNMAEKDELIQYFGTHIPALP